MVEGKLVPMGRNEKFLFKCMVKDCKHTAQIKKEIGERTLYLCFDHSDTDGENCIYKKEEAVL